jgi:hypothetical protein
MSVFRSRRAWLPISNIDAHFASPDLSSMVAIVQLTLRQRQDEAQLQHLLFASLRWFSHSLCGQHNSITAAINHIDSDPHGPWLGVFTRTHVPQALGEENGERERGTGCSVSRLACATPQQELHERFILMFSRKAPSLAKWRSLGCAPLAPAFDGPIYWIGFNRFRHP